MKHFPSGGVPRMHKSRAILLVGAQGYQMLISYKPVVAQNIVLHAMPAYRASTYLVPSLCLPSSFNLISPTFLKFSTAVCVLSSESGSKKEECTNS